MGYKPTLESYVRALWTNRYTMGAIVFGLAAATAVVTLLMPKVYEAEAQLMMLEPQFKSELASKTPSVQSCQALLNHPKVLREVQRWLGESLAIVDHYTSGQALSPEYVNGIQGLSAGAIQLETGADAAIASFIDKLDPDGLKGLRDFTSETLKAMTIEDLQDALSSHITEEKKTAIETVFSPVIRLRARGKTGEQAALLANTWAAVFLSIYGEKIRASIVDSHDLLTRETKRFQDERKDLQDKISDAYMRYNQSFLTQWLDTATKDFGELQLELARRRMDLDSETSRIASLARMLNAVEDQGTWIGASTSTVPLAKRGVTAPEIDMRANLLGCAERFRRAAADLEQFRAREDLDTLRKEYEQAQFDLVSFQSQLKKSVVAADETSKTLAKVGARLAATSRTLTLQRSTSGTAARAEIVNPEWDNLQLQRSELDIEHEKTCAIRAKLEPYIRTVSQSVGEMEGRRNRLEREFEALTRRHDLAKAEFEAYEQAYVRTKGDVHEAARTAGPLRARVEHLAAAVDRLRTQIEDAQTSVTRGRAVLTQLESKDESLQEYVKLSLQRLHEAELALAQKSLDVILRAEAIPPTKKIWPQRTLMVAGMAFLSLFLAVGLVLSRHYLDATGLWTRR